MKQILSQDAVDMLQELHDAGVRFLIVGGHALAVHGVSRATVDLDIFIQASPENADRVIKALTQFGAPLQAHKVGKADFERENTIYQLGLPPNRIDLLTTIDGVGFEQAWADRVDVEIDGIPVAFIGKAALLLNKRSAGRPKDLADVAALEGIT